MPAIIIALDADRQLHSCSGVCFDSVETECQCLCGGRNHGIGLHAALEQNRLWLQNPNKLTLPDGRPVAPCYIATTPNAPGEPLEIFRPPSEPDPQ